MCGHHIQQSTNQLRKVANPVHSQLNREKFPCPRSRLRIWFRETGLVVPSLAPACSFSILTLNLALTHGIPPEFRGGVHILLPAPHTIGSVTSLSGHAIARTDCVHCRESAGTGPVVLEVVRVTGAADASPWTKCYCALLFSHTHY